MRPKAEPLIEGSDSLRARPQLAALVSEAIASWADVQFGLGVVLSALTGAGAEQAVAMFLALTSSAAQLAALRAAAEVKLTREELELFQAVMIAVGAVEKQRNKLAHHIWAHAKELPNAPFAGRSR